jgi:galactokinase
MPTSHDDQTSFQALFARAAESSASAPGRVNLIGEHTDYNGGYVLPIAIPQRTRIDLARRSDDRVRAWSANVADRDERLLDYRLGGEQRSGRWIDYVAGVTQVLATQEHAIRGFDARIESEIPLGAGLGSSAALEVALLRALRDAFGIDVDDLHLALLGQRAEYDFVGAPVGVMDQIASSLADERSALFLDTRSLEWRSIPLPETIELVVIDSGVPHDHARGDYRVRRDECERAAQLLGVAQLRDVKHDDLADLDCLPEPLGRRARHVVTENQRVLDTIEAMTGRDVVRLGALLDASHESMRDDFEISIPEIDTLVELARSETEVYGARLTGGGFGGSVVIMAQSGAAAGVARTIARRYGERTGRLATVLVPGSLEGAAAA